MIDWTIVLSALIASVPLTIAAVTNLFATLRVEKHTNGMKDALVAAAKIEGKAEGKQEEQQKQP